MNFAKFSTKIRQQIDHQARLAYVFHDGVAQGSDTIGLVDQVKLHRGLQQIHEKGIKPDA